MSKSTLWWVLGAVVVLGLFISSRFISHSAQNSFSNRQAALICTTDMATQFHIHPHIQIIIDGVTQEIPANIGISLDCMHPLHTHDTGGTLHVESPEAWDFTLGDFFAVWGQTFNKDQILNSKADATHAIGITLNGQEVSTYENTILHDNDQIVISYVAKQ